METGGLQWIATSTKTQLAVRRYVPRGWKAEDGRVDDRYNLIELSTQLVSRANQEEHRESDGIVIFSLERVLSGGTRLTLELANKLGKPVLRIYDTRKERITSKS